MEKKWECAVFDMDGTTLDTVGDLQEAINYAMGQAGLRSDFTLRDAAAFFGSGIRVAAVRALSLERGGALADLERIGTEGDGTVEENAAEADRIAAIFRPYYTAHSEQQTCPYPGVTELLEELRGAGIRTAVVSNKPDAAVQLLCEKYFPSMLDAAMGEQEPDIRRKPAPDMVLKVLEQLGFTPEQAVYIGDSEVDLETAANCGMDCIIVTWGFRSRAFLEAHGARVIADSAGELEKLLLQSREGLQNKPVN
jgi:phosphoglycolate phosphatase